ncbi:hypothetical protein GGR52DRAFT_508627 [Hypoxylon sp. FL1284]|nr:hypothetical protein GGR52DRAFT_508627 [Hypoxylon sp. FL1284]
MDGYYNPPKIYYNTNNNDLGAAGPNEIEAWATICDFLESIGTDFNALDETSVPTPELPFSIPALPHDQAIGTQQDPPWNQVDGSPNAVDKSSRLQLDLSCWLIRKVHAYYLALARCEDLTSWLEEYGRSKDIVNDGLRTLADISHDRNPEHFDSILCAMVVQHAVYVFARERNLFMDVNESAFTIWGGMIPTLTEANQKVLNTVFGYLKSSDGSSTEHPPSSWPSDQSVSGVGDRFTSNVSYPMAVDNNSLDDPPQHGQVITDSSLNPPAGNYPIDPYASQALNFTGYVWDSNNFGDYGQASNDNTTPYMFDTANQYPTIERQSISPSLSGMYQTFQHPNNLAYKTQISPAALSLSNPFRCFMQFMNNLKNCGDLLTIFSHGSIQTSNRSPHSKGRSAEKQFYLNAKSSFFDPLETAVKDFPPIARAIVSTTLSMVQDKIHSYEDTADYMVHLSKHLLPSPESCASFARIVLKTCPTTAKNRLPQFMNQAYRDEEIDRRVEETRRDWRGAYYPLYLQDLTSRGNRDSRSKSATRTGGKQLTLSNLASSGSNGPSYWNTATEGSIAPTTNTTPSGSSTVRCPLCDKSFSGRHAKSHLSRHKRDHRDVDTQIKCPVCDKVFHHTRTDNVRTHCRNVHHTELPKDGRKLWERKPLASEP